MAKGATSKEVVTAKILETFDGAFVYDKTIRIPMIEDGAELQVKVTLTAAKDIVEPGADTAVPTVKTKGSIASNGEFSFPSVQKINATEEEKNSVAELMESLGL